MSLQNAFRLNVIWASVLVLAIALLTGLDFTLPRAGILAAFVAYLAASIATSRGHRSAIVANLTVAFRCCSCCQRCCW